MKTLLKDTNLPEDLVEELTDTGFMFVSQLYEAMLKDPSLMSRFLLRFNLDYDDLMKQVMEYL